MFYALKEGKSKRNEDTLTSSIFGLMLKLRTENPQTDLMWEILCAACFNKELNNKFSAPGKLEEFEFWPWWELGATAAKKYDQRHVEPDLFLSFEKLDVIIEAKRSDANQQYEDQWKRELSGYFTSVREGRDKPVCMFAVGGLYSHKTKPIELTEIFMKAEVEAAVFKQVKEGSINVYKFTWERILEQIIKLKKKQDFSREIADSGGILCNVLIDLIGAFDLHGYIAYTWFETLPAANFSGITDISSHGALNAWNPAAWKS